MTLSLSSPADPVVQRVKHELKRRTLLVADTERLTPNMLRITLNGDELSDFTSASPDDHLKVLIDTDDGEVVMRDYTPRRFSNEERKLVLDFALHEAGPATAWALNAKVGDTLNIAGPRGSKVITGQISKWLMIGDETALPAIGRRIEDSRPGVSFTTLVAVPSKDDQQTFKSAARTSSRWIHRPTHEADDAACFMRALKHMEVTPDTFVWIAAEGLVARTLRRYFLDELKHPAAWLKAAGYWIKGKADAKENFE